MSGKRKERERERDRGRAYVEAADGLREVTSMDMFQQREDFAFLLGLDFA
jgi:hypothetical protein